MGLAVRRALRLLCSHIRLTGARSAPSATIFSVMANLSRRKFLIAVSAATLAAAGRRGDLSFAAPRRQRVFIGSGTPDGILAYDWDSAAGELTPGGGAPKPAHVA